MNSVQKFLASLLGFQLKTETRYPLGEEDIKTNEIIKGLAQQNATKDIQIAKLLASRREEDTKKREEELEEDFIDRLNEQKAEIKDTDYGKPVSLMGFFKLLLDNKKFRDSFEICDRSDNVVFGKFGDWLITKGGKFAITDTEGNVRVRGSNPHQLFFKPDSFLNQVRRKRLLLAVNEQGVRVPDIEEMEAPNVSYNEETGEYDEAKEDYGVVKDMLVEREQKINELRDELERHEKAMSKLRITNADLKRASRVYENQQQVTQTELSKAMDTTMQFSANIGDLQKQIVGLTETKAMNERIISSLEKINDALVKKAEAMGVKGDFELVLEQVKDLMEWSKDNTPEIIHKYEAEEKKPMEVAQPGQRLK